MSKKNNPPKVIVDKNSTYGKKPPIVITSQGTPEHNKPSFYTMSAHDKAELFIAKMRAEREKNANKKVKTTKSDSKKGGKKKK